MLKNTLTLEGTVNRGICKADRDGTLRDVVEVEEIQREGEGARGRANLYNLMIWYEKTLTGNGGNGVIRSI